MNPKLNQILQEIEKVVVGKRENVEKIMMAVLAGGMETLNLAELSAHADVNSYYSLGYFDNDQWGREGEFAWHDLDPEITEIDCRFARSRYRHLRIRRQHPHQLCRHRGTAR